MIAEIRIVPTPGGVGVQQIEAGVVVAFKAYPTKEAAERAAHKAGVKTGAPVGDWTKAE